VGDNYWHTVGKAPAPLWGDTGDGGLTIIGVFDHLPIEEARAAYAALGQYVVGQNRELERLRAQLADRARDLGAFTQSTVTHTKALERALIDLAAAIEFYSGLDPHPDEEIDPAEAARHIAAIERAAPLVRLIPRPPTPGDTPT
jgi:hypothetical protein